MVDKKLRTKIFEITDLDCPDCAMRVEKEVSKLPGIKLVKVDYLSSKLNVEYDAVESGTPDIKKAVNAAGHHIKEKSVTQSSVFYVKGMDCANESRPIEKRLRKIQGIHDLKFNLINSQLTVEHQIPIREIQKNLKDLGFESVLAEHRKDKTQQTFWQTYRTTILTIISGIGAISGLILEKVGFSATLTIPVYLMAILTGGFRIGFKGFKEAKNLTLGMDFLMSIAVIGAMIIGEWTEAALVIFLFALAQLVESYSVDRARRSIHSLMEIAPNVATVQTEHGIKTIPVEDVNIGELILVKPGERVPLDAVVVSGQSTINQAPITGESIPVDKSAGNQLYAGTINQRGILEARVSKAAGDSTLARIIQLVEKAQSEKAPTQTFVEKFARIYTPAMVGFAFLLAVVPPLLFGGNFMEWFYRALVLLVISCPCALVISTPVTIVSALTNAARNGILIKGGIHIENFNSINTLAFDKTGTLTTGNPVVQSVHSFNDIPEEEILKIAATIESRSEHPLAQAIERYAEKRSISFQKPEFFESLTGEGVKAVIDGKTFFLGNHRLFEERGFCDEEVHEALDAIEKKRHTAVLIGKEQNVLGIISIADELRENAGDAINDLKKSGIHKTIMLTGDNRITADTIADQLNIDEALAELLPEDKVSAVKHSAITDGKIAMIGDGINDAPALAAADIGISMGVSGTDTALETADIALMKDDLTKLAFLKKLSRKTVLIIKQNIFIALFLKGLFFLLAVPGWATLWMAVFADMGASLIVTFNGLRALNLKK